MRKDEARMSLDIHLEKHVGPKEKQLQDRLKQSIEQSKEGKTKSRGSFAKHIEDEVYSHP